MAKCPSHTERTGSLSIKDGYAGVLVFCFGGCSQGEVIQALQDRGLWPQREERKREPRPSRPSPQRLRSNLSPDLDRARRIDYARHIWREAKDPRGSLAETYLRSRGLTLPDELAGRVLRFHAACPWEKNTVPALIAAFHPIGEPDADAMPVAIMRIGLTDDGSKIAKKMLGPVAGAAIKLDVDEDVTIGLHIAEGLETALAARERQAWRPMWALGSASAFPAFAPLPGIECLTIAADHDYAGLAAAQRCAERWAAAGKEAFIRWPDGLGRDFADQGHP
jgi:hypothetical protein